MAAALDEAPFLGADDACVAALAPALNCLPRAAALELLEAPLGAARLARGGAHALARDAGGDVSLALHFSAAPDARAGALDLRGAEAWDSLRGARANVRVVLSAVPDALVAWAARGLARAGRAVTALEPCRTWEPRADSFLARGGGEAAARAAAAAALPAGFALGALRAGDAGAVAGAWKYRTRDSEAMVAEAVAARPSAAVRAEADGALCAWAVLRSDASWGLVGVAPALRRRGLARALMLHAFAEQAAWAARGAPARAAAAAGLAGGAPRAAALAALLAPYVHIAVGNAASEGLFRALGFEPGAGVTWVMSAAGALLPPAPPRAPPPPPLRELRLLPRAAPRAAWAALLALINESYREDDAFFVDQRRTDAATLDAMAAEGDFYVASRARVEAEVAGAGAREGAGGADDVADGEADDAPLGACVYVRVAAGAAAPFSADARAGEGGGGEESAGAPPAPPPPPPPRAAGAPSAAAPPGSRVAPPPTGAPAASLSMLAVAPALKRRGLAARVLAAAEARAAAAGALAVDVFVVSVKPWLRAFYEKAGYAAVGAEPWPAALEHELVRDCYFVQMRRVIAGDGGA